MASQLRSLADETFVTHTIRNRRPSAFEQRIAAEGFEGLKHNMALFAEVMLSHTDFVMLR
jgi:hypothetical protein